MTILTTDGTVLNDFGSYFKLLSNLDQATITAFSSTSVTYSLGANLTYTVTGTGLIVTIVDGEATITGGTIDGISLSDEDAGTLFHTSGMNLSGTTFGAALASDRAGTDSAALEAVFTAAKYTFEGSDGIDQYQTATSTDGASLTLTGNNTWNLYGGVDTVTAGSGKDQMFGGDGNDRLDGGDGNDRLNGDGGDDILKGGNGADLMKGGTGGDSIGGGDGADAINGEAGNDILSGDAGDDSMGGSSGDDSLAGGTGNDSLGGSAGNDTADGGAGNDLLTGGGGNDSLNGGDGDDIVQGESQDDDVHGGAGKDSIDGGAGVDALFGDDGDDVLVGGDGDDSLVGGAGRDSLIGGAGRDVMTGGAGERDVFVFASFDDLGKGDKRDVILDFEHRLDRIDLTALGLTLLDSGDAFTGPNQARITPDNLLIQIDQDGDGKIDFQIEVAGGQPFGPNDILI